STVEQFLGEEAVAGSTPVMHLAEVKRRASAGNTCPTTTLRRVNARMRLQAHSKRIRPFFKGVFDGRSRTTRIGDCGALQTQSQERQRMARPFAVEGRDDLSGESEQTDMLLPGPCGSGPQVQALV